MGYNNLVSGNYFKLIKRNYANLEKLIRDCTKNSNFKRKRIGKIEFSKKNYGFYKIESINGLDYNVCLAAGIHGDEYEGIFALLEFLKNNGRLLKKFDVTAFPVINPEAYVLGKREIREDINRSFGKEDAPLKIKLIEDSLDDYYDLFIDMHSDESASGFSCFERRRKKLPSLGKRIITKMKKKFEIETTEAYIESGEGTIKNFKNYGGVIKSYRKRESTFEAFMFKRGALYSMTFELPGALESFEKKIFCGHLALKTALKEFYKIKKSLS